MILGIGTDIVLTSRFSRMLQQNPQRLRRLAERILHKDEIAQLNYDSPVRQLASAWAAKEALFKSLDSDEQPDCRFNKWRKTKQNGRYELVSDDPRSDKLLLSLSHDGDYTVAMVVRSS